MKRARIRRWCHPRPVTLRRISNLRGFRSASRASRTARSVGLRRPPARRRPRLRQGRSWNWTAIAAVIAALASAAGVYFTGRSLDATRTQNTVTEQGQLTDRFTKAVDQLDRTGTDHLQARLGAIYALERLARDSPRDQPTIIEVLSAFIRTTTPRPTPAPAGTLKSNTTCPAQSVAPDVQAALAVLGRRDTTHDQRGRIDLVDTCLTGAVLSGADLRGANLTGTNLSGAVLKGVQFLGVNFGRTNFGDEDVAGTNLNGADLRGADLRGTGLLIADLRGANLHYAKLGGTYLVGKDFSGMDFSGADLSHTNLTGADLRGTNLVGAMLVGTNLAGADLSTAVHDEMTDIAGAITDQHTKGMWW